MKKKSLFALFSSLAISGLLLAGSANAMTYKVNGNTQVAIPRDTTDGIIIDWGDETQSQLSSCALVELPEINHDVRQCTKNYEGEHTINIYNQNHTRVETIYLSQSNIKEITNFGGFSNLKMIYLDNNLIEQVDENAFDGLNENRLATVFLRNNRINNFLPSLDKITSLYLNNDNNGGLQLQGNSLTTIPATIRSARSNTTIKLSNTISYGDTSKPHLADLRNNPIKFVGLTNHNYNSYNDNHFERFGYDYENAGSETYYYKILQNGMEINNTTGTTPGNEIEINTPLKPGDYTFEVCINGDSECNYNDTNIRNFSINYEASIEFDTYPDDKIYSTDNISFTRHKEGYPDALIGGYSYILTKEGAQNPIDSNSTTNGFYYPDTTGRSNGNYELTVYLVDSEGNHLLDYDGNEIYATTSFELQVNNTITIEKPIPAGIQAEGINTIEIPLKWSTESQAFSYFKYIITTDTSINCESYTDNGNMTRINKSPGLNNGTYTYSGSTNLPQGDYILCVQMYNNNDNLIGFESRLFLVNVITEGITITSPSEDGQIFSGDGSNNIEVPIELNTSSSLFGYYKYYITSSNTCNGNNIIIEPRETAPGVKNFSTSHTLGNGTYRVCVDMYTSNGDKINTTPESRSFKVEISPKLTITSPQDDPGSNNPITVGTVTFERNADMQNPYSLDHYAYSLYPKNTTKPAKTSVEESFTRTLDDGTYIFELDMYYKNGEAIAETPITKSIEFTMSMSTQANISINSPSVDNQEFTGHDTTETNKSNVTLSWNGVGTQYDHYKYKLSNWDNYITLNKSDAPNGEYSTTIKLPNGTYTLTVEMYNNIPNLIDTATRTFKVNIPTTVNILHPDDNSTESNETTSISWEGFTPYTCTNYEYEITGPNNFSTISKTTNNCNETSYELNNRYDGQYTFKVRMNYNDGAQKSTEWEISNFTVNTNEGANLDITSPNNGEYRGEYVKTVPIDFTWNGGGSPSISKYSYKLINTKYNTNETSGFVNKNTAGHYSIPESPLSLPNGTYKFEVTMLDSQDNPIIPTESRIFTVSIPTIVEIQSPATGSSIPSATTTFTWTGFSPYTCIGYEYTLTGPDGFTPYSDTANCDETGFEIKNLRDGTYTFKIRIKYNDGEDKYTNYATSTFTVNSSTNKYLNITSPIDGGNYTPANGVEYGGDYKVPVTFTWNGGGSALVERYSYKIIDSSSHEILSDTIDKNDSGEYSISAQSLSKGSYTFEVDMLDSDNKSIMKKVHSFDVNLPARIKITNPTQGTTVTSSSTKFTWTGYSDTITNYQYNLVKSGDKDNIVNVNNRSFSRNLTNGNYTLTVWISSGGNLVASDTINFTVSRKSGGGGGGGGSSSKSHQTNKLSVDITNESPSTNEWIELKVDIDDKYTGKVDFTKMQYYSTEDEKWIDIPVTSKNYVSDYGDEAKLGYVKFDSSDDGEKELSNFIKISQKGNYRIYAEDKDGYNDYVQFYVGKGNGNNNTVKSTNTTTVTSTPTDTEDEVFIARSCKRYKITYSSSLNVYTSPNLNMSEYFMNKDYFKRYIDSKNRYQDGCPTNIGWISTSYYDKTNDNTRYTAPNGKVYFITGQEGNYYSNELNKELKTPTSFSTIQQLKYYIRDRNPLINMATLGPVS